MNPPDVDMMHRAVALARRGWGQTRPNPHVGAIVVREGRVIGEGWHRRAGEPHAEIEALRACREDPRGATLYVTLEPCNHHGRTPPCTDAILAAGIARVVVGQRDPNPAAYGGVHRLWNAGVQVETGVCEQECLLLNPAFNTFHALGRPMVTLKWAMSADGCTSTASGQSAWISGEAARTRAHQLRAESDAVLVGVETAIRDNARLTIRGVDVPPGPPLRRIVMDSRLRLPPDHPFVRETQGPAIVVCTEDAPRDAEQRLAHGGAEIWRLQKSGDGETIDAGALLGRLHAEGVQSLLVEGGRRVAGAFLAAGLVDRVAVFFAPKLVGSGEHALSALQVPAPIDHMDRATPLHHAEWEAVGPDMLLSAWITTHLFPRNA